MRLASDPGELLEWLPSEAIPHVQAMLASIGMARLPSDVRVDVEPDSTEVLIQGRWTEFRSPTSRGHKRSVARLREHLTLARDAGTRRILIALAGRREDDAPAWAWLAPRLLRDLLHHADCRPTSSWTG